LISEALKQELLAEFRAIPPIEELEKMYTFSERHERQMALLFATLREKERKEMLWQKVRKVAIIVIAILAFAFASVKFVPEVYAYVKEWLMELADDESIEFRGSSKEISDEDCERMRFELGYVPEGYELEREILRKTGANILSYKHYDGAYFYFEYRGKATDNLVAVNSEEILIEKINDNGIEYYIFDSMSGKVVVTWEYGGYLLKLSGILEKEQILYMAISVMNE